MKNWKTVSMLILFQLVFTSIQTYLVGKISWIGKVGIKFMYKEYAFLRSGWKTYLVLFGTQLLVIAILWAIHEFAERKIKLIAGGLFFIIAICGLAYTYDDFQHTYSHRLLKERFHLGFYLFWIGWLISCVFFLLKKKSIVERVEIVARGNDLDESINDRSITTREVV